MLEELAAAETSTRNPRERRDALAGSMAGATDPKEAKRAQLKLKRLRYRLEHETNNITLAAG